MPTAWCADFFEGQVWTAVTQRPSPKTCAPAGSITDLSFLGGQVRGDRQAHHTGNSIKRRTIFLTQSTSP